MHMYCDNASLAVIILCAIWIDFAKYGCANSWAEVQADYFHFVCRGCMTVKCLQEQVNELRHMNLMMTGQGEKE